MPVHPIGFFDVWQPNYNAATVRVYIAGTTTLASLYTDEALSVAAANPQTLESQASGGVNYGKFATPLYTSSPFYLEIDSTDQTGILRVPITELPGQDASDATAIADGGTETRPIDEHLADVIKAANYGDIGASESAATNNATITAAIGAAAAQGGGSVMIPAGDIEITTLTLSANVRLIGEGREITNLKSTEQDKVITATGDRAGLGNLTVDGVSTQAGSIGFYSVGNAELFMDDVQFEALETGMHFKGLSLANFRELYVKTCTNGVKLHGDVDSGNGSEGGKVENNRWRGGGVYACSGIGLDLSYEDREVSRNDFAGISVKDNTGTGVNINGARFTTIDAAFSGNTTNWAIDDDSDADITLRNDVQHLRMRGAVNGGAATFAGICDDVVLEGMDIQDVDFTLTLPENAILLLDCVEDADVTISGDGTKFTRAFTAHDGVVNGITTGASATKAWSATLNPGEVASARAMVTGNQRNGTNIATYIIEAAVSRPGSDLDYDNLTGTFSAAETVTGGTSGATGIVQADASNTLTLRSIIGEFENNEQITGGTSGATADADGTLTAQNVVVNNQVKDVDFEDVAGWNAAFVANGGEIELQVTGATSTTIDWSVRVDIVRNG